MSEQAEKSDQTSTKSEAAGEAAEKAPPPKRGRGALFFTIVLVFVAAMSALIAALLVNIFQRKQEAKNPYLRLVEVTEETTDPEKWKMNWPREYDGYVKTIDPTQTKFGGSEAMPAQKAAAHPWLTRMFAGYAF